jgi:hypothetical protein
MMIRVVARYARPTPARLDGVMWGMTVHARRLTHDDVSFGPGVTPHLIGKTAWRHTARLYRMPAELAHIECASRRVFSLGLR